MPARHYIRLTKEATFKTFNASPGANEQIILQVPSGNASTIRNQPLMWTERSAGASNRKVMTGSRTNALAGKLTQKLFPSQAAFWMPQIFTLAGTPLDLASFTMDEVLVMSTGTKKYHRTLGCKVDTAMLKANNTPGGMVWSMDLDIVGSTPATITVSDFAEPAITDYPTDNPYVFQDCAGNLTVGSSFTNFESLTLSVKNILPKDQFDEYQYLQRIPWCGRDIEFDLKVLYKGTTLRTDLEGIAAIAVSCVLDDGTVATTLDMEATNYITDVADDMPFESSYKQAVKITNLLDTTAGTDITVTVV